MATSGKAAEGSGMLRNSTGTGARTLVTEGMAGHGRPSGATHFSAPPARRAPTSHRPLFRRHPSPPPAPLFLPPPGVTQPPPGVTHFLHYIVFYSRCFQSSSLFLLLILLLLLFIPFLLLLLLLFILFLLLLVHLPTSVTDSFGASLQIRDDSISETLRQVTPPSCARCQFLRSPTHFGHYSPKYAN